MTQRSGFTTFGRALLTTLILLIVPALGGALEVGDEAPDFTLPDLDGLDYTLSGYSTHPVLLMFLGCDEEVSIALAPLVQNDFYNTFVQRGLRILGIECQGNNREALAQFGHVTGVSFPLLLGGQQTLADYDLPVSSFVVVDGNGTVRYIAPGPTDGSYDRSAMAEMIDGILRETNAEKQATWGMIKSLYGN